MSNEKEDKGERKIVSFSVSPPLYEKFEKEWKRRAYPNRSNAIRDLLESFVSEEVTEVTVIAIIVVIYDHDEADLAQVVHIQHLHMDSIKTLASFHLHLDDNLCSDLIAVRGSEELVTSVEKRFRQVPGVQSVRRAVIHVET